MKRSFITTGALLLALAVAWPASANYDSESIGSSASTASGFEAEFGTCTVDPVYEEAFVGKTITSSRLRNRACMADSETIGTIPANTEVKVQYRTDGWYRVKMADGRTGWVGQALIEQTGQTEFSAGAKTALTGTDKSAAKANDKLKGYIVLAVQSKGEAFYVTPEGHAVYLQNGKSAFEIMRELGLGVTNADLAKLQAGNQTLLGKLRGRIVLAVEGKGEAYYVSPKKAKLFYLKNGQTAFELLRSEGLGISNANYGQLNKKSVSEAKNAKMAATKKTIEAKKVSVEVKQKIEATGSNGSISLGAAVTGKSVKLSWSLSGFESAKGFKAVVSEQESPVYPGNEYHYLPDAGAKTDTWQIAEAGTYYFRVCEYLGGKCGVYSNNVKVVIE